MFGRAASSQRAATPAWVEGGEVEVAGLRELLHRLEPATVGRGPAPQRGLGVDTAGARHHHRRREHLGEIGLEVVAPGAQAGDRDVDAVEGFAEVAGIEPDRRRLAEQLVRVEQRRQAGRDALDDRRRALLRLLDLLPVAHDVGGLVGDDVAEDVRVAAHELVVDAARDVGHGERAGLLREHRVEHDLVEEVAELVLERGVRGAGSIGPSAGSASTASTTSYDSSSR